MQSLCPGCGEPSADGLCPKCTLESIQILKCPDKVEVTICSVCGSMQTRRKWQLPDDRSIEDLASQAACDALEVHRDLEAPKIEVSLSKRGATRYLANIEVEGSFQGLAIKERCDIPVRIRLVACDRCSRMAGKYFQSTVQVRMNGSRPLTTQETEECRRIAISMADAGYRSGDQLSFIQEIKDVKGGLDIVLGSTQLGRHLARAIQERFGGRFHESCKLVGRKDNRDVYRSTLLVRFPRLKAGDIVVFRGVLFEVMGFDGKKTLVESLYEGRRSSLSDENSEAAEILGNRADAKEAVVISRDDKVLEIMDPETYKTVLAPRPSKIESVPGESVQVVRTAKGFIVLE
jgi:nonsense-mediated mRNA decay protein 3